MDIQNNDLPKEYPNLKPFLPLMENAVSGLGDNPPYNLSDVVKLAADKNIVIGDSENIEVPIKAIIILPANEKLPIGKYMDLAPIRKALEQLPYVRMQEIVTFVNEYPFEQDMYDYELVDLIVNRFSEKETA